MGADFIIEVIEAFNEDAPKLLGIDATCLDHS